MNKLIILTSTLLLLSSCSGDNRFPRYFTVNFETGETGEKIPAQTVKEGYTINLVNQIANPRNTRENIFRGWYTTYDSESGLYSDQFDIENYRVFQDMTLYAKWSFPTESPSEFTIGNDAFSKTVTWIQKGITNTTNFTIQITKGEKHDVYIHDDILDEDGDIDFNALAIKNPDCRVWLYDIPRMTTGKKDYVGGVGFQ